MTVNDERVRIRKRLIVADLRVLFQHSAGSRRISSFRIIGNLTGFRVDGNRTDNLKDLTESGPRSESFRMKPYIENDVFSYLVLTATCFFFIILDSLVNTFNFTRLYVTLRGFPLLTKGLSLPSCFRKIVCIPAAGN